MKTFTLSILLLLTLAGCDSSYQNTPNSTSQSSEGSEQTSQNGETTTSETSTQSYTKATSLSSHYQGDSCLRCHNKSYYTTFGAPERAFREDDGYENEGDESYENDNEQDEGENEEFLTSGATLYGELHGDNDTLTKGYSLRLVLESTHEVITYHTGRGTSNFSLNTNYNLNNFTAQVVDANGNILNTSQTNSHDGTRLDCNKCHTQNGNSGAPGRISVIGIVSTTSSSSSSVDNTPTSNSSSSSSSSSASIPSKALSFSQDVMPILESKCKACHGSNGRFKVTTNSETFNNLTVNGFLNSTNPDDSKLLQKARNFASSHGGGAVLVKGSAHYTTLSDWMIEGAQNN